MLKLSKSRLLKSIPLFGFVFFLAVYVGLAWFEVPRDVTAAFVFGPALLLFLVTVGLIRLQTAIVIQCVVTGVWWQYGDGPYLTTIIGTLVGLKLGEWVEAQWKRAIDRAKAEETFTTLSVGNSSDTEQPAGTDPQQRA